MNNATPSERGGERNWAFASEWALLPFLRLTYTNAKQNVQSAVSSQGFALEQITG